MVVMGEINLPCGSDYFRDRPLISDLGADPEEIEKKKFEASSLGKKFKKFHGGSCGEKNPF